MKSSLKTLPDQKIENLRQFIGLSKAIVKCKYSWQAEKVMDTWMQFRHLALPELLIQADAFMAIDVTRAIDSVDSRLFVWAYLRPSNSVRVQVKK